MTIFSSLVLAEAGQASPEPLFGNQLYALAAVLVGVAALLFAVAAVGRWLASTHPKETSAPAASADSTAPSAAAPAASTSDAGPSPEIFAVIAAAVAATFGSKAQIASINTLPVGAAEGVASGRLQWSMEGRRQIYSSHKVR